MEKRIKSMRDALWAIANMQIKPDTDKAEVLALCMGIAKIELEKDIVVNSNPEIMHLNGPWGFRLI